MLTWVACLFPLELKWISLHPITIVWSSAFLVFVNPAAGVVSIVLLIAAWLLGRFTNVVGLVTPFDIHSYTTSPRSVAALAGAPEGTYLAAVRRAALSGRSCMFVASGLGSVLEGALRTATCSKNTVTGVLTWLQVIGLTPHHCPSLCLTIRHQNGSSPPLLLTTSEMPLSGSKLQNASDLVMAWALPCANTHLCTGACQVHPGGNIMKI